MAGRPGCDLDLDLSLVFFPFALQQKALVEQHTGLPDFVKVLLELFLCLPNNEPGMLTNPQYVRNLNAIFGALVFCLDQPDTMRTHHTNRESRVNRASVSIMVESGRDAGQTTEEAGFLNSWTNCNAYSTHIMSAFEYSKIQETSFVS